jgi:predicted branched-subunit amino acid permease
MTTRQKVIRDSLIVGLTTGAYAVPFGAIAVAAGASVLETCALSLLMFTGASQFALVGVIASGGSPLAGVASAVLLGTRNALYGLRLSSLIEVRGAQRALASHFVIDESTAMAMAHEPKGHARTAFWATGLGVFVFWNLGTLVGALGTQALPSPKTLGLDGVVPAAFLALLGPRLRQREALVVGGLAAVVALAAVSFLPVGLPILLVAPVAVLAGLRLRR